MSFIDRLLARMEARLSRLQRGAPPPSPTPPPRPRALAATGALQATDGESAIAEGNSALQSGDLARAGTCYEEALRADPASPLPRVNLAFVCLEQGRPQEAQRLLEDALALRRGAKDTHVGDAQFLLGRAHRALGNPREALGWFEQAIATRDGDFPEAQDAALALAGPSGAGSGPEAGDADTWGMRAEAHRQAGRFDEALAAVDQVLSLEADDAHALSLRGTILAQMNRPEEALASHDRALAKDPQLVPALVDSALPLLHTGAYDEALRRLDLALALAPGHPQALFNKGTVLMRQMRPREALAVFEEHLARHPPSPEVTQAALSARRLLAD